MSWVEKRGSESEMESYMIVDIDNIRTQAVIVEKIGGKYCISGAGVSKSTIEPPELDVTVGVKKAISDIEKIVGKSFLKDGDPTLDFLCTSNISGGLHMLVAGVIEKISTESAQRAALGAGAFLMDIFSKDDNRQPYQKIALMRSLKPDIFLVAGGTDGGAVQQVIEMILLIEKADIKPRYGESFKLPVIYAGNIEVREKVFDILSEDNYAIKAVENVRPVIDIENLGPAKEEIYDTYMKHVIIHAPGFEKLVEISKGPILPTQAGIGKILFKYALEEKVNLLGVDIGGATTDIYSVYDGVFNRSLNADFGITEGILNVMKLTGVEKIMRWLPDDLSEKAVRNTIANIMVQQPKEYTLEQGEIVHAVAREAIFLGLEKHKTIASHLKGITRGLTISGIFDQMKETTHINLMKTHKIIGKGNLFNLKRPEISASILIDAIQPKGLTEILLDSKGFTAHLGVLSSINSEAAINLLKNDCLVRLCYCVSPSGRSKKDEEAFTMNITENDGKILSHTIKFGDIIRIPSVSCVRNIELTPTRKFDLSMGRGKTLNAEIFDSILGIIIDARGRPLNPSIDKYLWSKWREALFRPIELGKESMH
jgi:hypothetical protein